MPSNIDDVIADVEQAKDDLHDNIERAGRSSMGSVLFSAMGYVEADASWRGNLRKSLSLSVDDRGSELSFSVHTDPAIAPYAPFVEFGTGTHTNQITPRAPSVYPVEWPDEGSAVPVGFPYDSPAMGPNLVQSIIDWVKTKPITPEADMSQRQLGFVLAAQIVEEGTYAHPFLRPAWFDNELIVKSAIKTAIRKAFK